VVSASGVSLRPGTIAGSVVVVPQGIATLNACGFQCVKPQSCVTPRPLACSKWVDQGNSAWADIAPTPTDFSGNHFATRSEADKVCAQTLGAGYMVLMTSGINSVLNWQAAMSIRYITRRKSRPTAGKLTVDWLQ